MTGTFTVEQVVANILGDASTKYTKSSLLAALSCINSQNLQSSTKKKKKNQSKKKGWRKWKWEIDVVEFTLGVIIFVSENVFWVKVHDRRWTFSTAQTPR